MRLPKHLMRFLRGMWCEWVGWVDQLNPSAMLGHARPQMAGMVEQVMYLALSLRGNPQNA